uniref:Mucin n=1 Tax=Macrostomum lignano TaxID=282301 RepID=A0A1I8J1U6_9PLAT
LRCSTNATNSSNEVTTDFEVSYDHAASQAVEVGLRRCQDDVEVAENLPASEEAAAAAYALPSGQELPGNRLDSASGSSGSNSAKETPAPIVHASRLGDKEDEEKDDEATAPNQHQPPQLLVGATTASTSDGATRTRSTAFCASETSSD